LNPFNAVVVMVDVPEAPFLMLSELGEAEMEKSPGAGAVTVTLTPAVWVSDPLIPVTVRLYVPTAVVATFTVRVDVVEPPAGGVTGPGKVHVEPDGQPETLRLTEALKPFNEVALIVDVPELPC
jgi:hypothetical protein